MKVNFGKVSDDYAQYRDKIPEVIFDQLLERGLDFTGKNVVDLGCGTGIFSRALYKQGAQVVGVEPSEEMLQQAKRIDTKNQINIQYVLGPAEETGMPTDQFDVVTVVRAWHWFQRLRAIEEIKRILKTNGYLVVVDSVFNPSKCQITRDTMELVRKYTADGILRPAGSKGENRERRNGFPTIWFDEWEKNGFALVDTWNFEYDVRFTRDEWCGKIRTLSHVTNFDDITRNRFANELNDYLLGCTDSFHIPHSCYLVLLRK